MSTYYDIDAILTDSQVCCDLHGDVERRLKRYRKYHVISISLCPAWVTSVATSEKM